MIVFNLGQAKSGSTFIYQILITLRMLSKSSIKQVYYKKLTPEAFAEIEANDRPDELFVVKCHTGISDPLLRLLDEGKASVIVSFRDPRDSALAQIDAGTRDRKLGVDTLFVNFHDGQDILPEVKRQMAQAATLLDSGHPRIHAVPYFVLATDQDHVVRQVCDIVGLPQHAQEVIKRWPADNREKKVGQFNKGVANRFTTDLSVPDLRLLHSRLKSEAEYVDQKTRSMLANTRFASLYEDACRVRDETLERRLAPAGRTSADQPAKTSDIAKTSEPSKTSGQAGNPYSAQPGKAFWKLGVAEPKGMGAVQDLWRPKFPIRKSDVFITAGSCFAQHISRAITERGFNWLDAEPAPARLPAEAARLNGYGVYSFRTGNIYSPALLKQWVDWALDGAPDNAEAWEQDGGFIDPYRPNIEAKPFRSLGELKSLRDQTLAAIRRAVSEASIFVFTLGQTETWTNQETGHVYPMCPGTVAGVFDPDLHSLRVMRYGAIMRDMSHVIGRLSELNPKLKFLLTVSPVPTTATATDHHVLVASTYAKSSLRAAAADLGDDFENVDYFPSFEIIATHPSRGRFFDDNLRTVKDAGVQVVMMHLLKGINASAAGRSEPPARPVSPAKPVRSPEAPRSPRPSPATLQPDDVDPVCEEMLLEAFSPKGAK
jgi:hypothetical protein